MHGVLGPWVGGTCRSWMILRYVGAPHLWWVSVRTRSRTAGRVGVMRITHRCAPPVCPLQERESVENEILFRKLKGLLNKLTMDKFARLTEQILELPIDTSTRLKGAIYIVFDKALDEPTFSPMYAQLCLKMSIMMSQKEVRCVVAYPSLLPCFSCLVILQLLLFFLSLLLSCCLRYYSSRKCDALFFRCRTKTPMARRTLSVDTCSTSVRRSSKRNASLPARCVTIYVTWMGLLSAAWLCGW